MVMEPAVSMGMKMEAAVLPMPAKRVARAVNWFRALASELRAGTMPQ